MTVFVCLQGPAGLVGETGVPGPQGPQGPQGPGGRSIIGPPVGQTHTLSLQHAAPQSLAGAEDLRRMEQYL